MTQSENDAVAATQGTAVARKAHRKPGTGTHEAACAAWCGGGGAADKPVTGVSHLKGTFSSEDPLTAQGLTRAVISALL